MSAATTIRIHHVEIFDEPTAGADGAVVYELAHPDGIFDYMQQPFARGARRYVNGAHVWGWDGNEEAPTLDPSFVSVLSRARNSRVHLFLRGGKVDLLGDSTVRLA